MRDSVIKIYVVHAALDLFVNFLREESGLRHTQSPWKSPGYGLLFFDILSVRTFILKPRTQKSPRSRRNRGKFFDDINIQCGTLLVIFLFDLLDIFDDISGHRFPRIQTNPDITHHITRIHARAADTVFLKPVIDPPL